MHKYRLVLVFVLVLVFSAQVHSQEADIRYTDSRSGYEVCIQDGADLLSPEEEKELLAVMKPITRYGNVMFLSTERPVEDTAAYAQDYYHEIFGVESGTLLLFDMDNRVIHIFSDGRVYRTVTKQYALTITDNIYRYATNGNFFKAAQEAFRQEFDLLEKGRILQPMKILCSLLIAVVLSLLVSFICLLINRRPMTVTDRYGKVIKPGTRSIEFKANRVGQNNEAALRAGKSDGNGPIRESIEKNSYEERTVNRKRRIAWETLDYDDSHDYSDDVHEGSGIGWMLAEIVLDVAVDSVVSSGDSSSRSRSSSSSSSSGSRSSSSSSSSSRSSSGGGGGHKF